MRVIGLEPTRISPPDPKSGAAANYAIPAMLASLMRCKINANCVDLQISYDFLFKKVRAASIMVSMPCA